MFQLLSPLVIFVSFGEVEVDKQKWCYEEKLYSYENLISLAIDFCKEYAFAEDKEKACKEAMLLSNTW